MRVKFVRFSLAFFVKSLCDCLCILLHDVKNTFWPRYGATRPYERFNESYHIRSVRRKLTLSEPQSRCGDKALKVQLVSPQNGTVVAPGVNVGPPSLGRPL